MAKPTSKTLDVRVIEITVISAEGLLLNRRQPVKKDAFVVLKSDGPFNSRSTSMDRGGGSYPAWNEKMVLELPMHVRFITVEAHSGSKFIGYANVPVSDFAGGHMPENYLSFLSYRLRGAQGEKNGIVNMSVKVTGTTGNRDGGGGVGCSRPYWMEVPVDGKVCDRDHGVVTGIPVTYPC